MSKTRILIAGIGGVGGYFGGMLAKACQNNAEVEINFLARGAHLEKIKNNGLKVIHLDTEVVVHPAMVSDLPEAIGKVDYIIMATKSYDVAATAKALKPCVGSNTRILRLLNGVDSIGVLQAVFHENEMFNGSVYLHSKIKEPGVIENFGNIQKLFFGLDSDDLTHLKPLESIFKESGIDVTLSATISEITWAKFIFISAVATSTSYFDDELGAILETKEKRAVMELLVQEVTDVGREKGISIAPDILEKVMSKLESLPYSTTSSMQRDFRQNKTTELQSLTTFVIDEAKKLGIETPTYNKLFLSLRTR
jgi:2-dehydropantoate 2-reductase